MTWSDLSDDELRARLERRLDGGYEIEAFVRHRDDETTAVVIDGVLG